MSTATPVSSPSRTSHLPFAFPRAWKTQLRNGGRKMGTVSCRQPPPAAPYPPHRCNKCPEMQQGLVTVQTPGGDGFSSSLPVGHRRPSAQWAEQDKGGEICPEHFPGMRDTPGREISPPLSKRNVGDHPPWGWGVTGG